MNNLEQRNFNCEVRAEQSSDGSAYIEGRPIVFNSIYDNGCFLETISPRALDDANLSDVRLLVNHDLNGIPLARFKKSDNSSTMQLSIDENGLTIKASLDIDHNASAKALYSAVGRGDISGMSFMFTVDGEEWDDLKSEHPKRTITKISKVIEVSAVTLPAYTDTSISIARASQTLENARKVLDIAKSSASNELELLKLKTQLL